MLVVSVFPGPRGGAVFFGKDQSGTRRMMNHSRDKPLLVILYTSITCRRVETHRGVDLRARREPFLVESSKWP
jgi:hypothetical protein